MYKCTRTAFLLVLLVCIAVPLIAQIDSVELKQLEVVGKKRAQSPTQTELSLVGKELDKTQGLSLGESLRAIPGVSVLQTGPTIFKPVVQGMFGQRVLIVNNGVRQEGQQWGSEHAPEIDPFVANKMTVIKGASSVRYGSDAIGGVILIEPKPLRKENGIGGALFLGGFSANRGGSVSGVLDFSSSKMPGLSGRVQGSLRKFGNAKTPDYFLKNTGMEEYNFSYALGYSRNKFGVDIFYSQFNTKLGILSASHIGNLTDLKAAIASPVPLETSGFSYKFDRPMQQVVHELFKASAYLKIKNGGKLTAQYALQYNDRREYDKHKPLNDSLAAEGNPELELHITTHSANLIYDYIGSTNLTTTIGVSGIAQGNIYKGRYFIPNFASYAGGIFWIEQWEKKRWKVEAGVRYDYKWLQAYYYKSNEYQSPSFVFSNFSGSLGLAYQFNNDLRLKANAGTAFRPPHVSELFSNGLHHGAASVEIGDDKLKAEQAYNFSLSPELSHKKLSAGASIYYTYIHNYIYLAPVFPATLTIRGAFPTFQYKQVEAEFAGIDIWGSDSLTKHFTLNAKASIVHAYNRTANQYLVLTPPSRIEGGLTYQFNVSRKIVHPYIGFSFPVVFKKNNLPDSSDYAPAPNGYVLLDAQAGFSIRLGKNIMDVYLSGSNLTNKVYRDYLDRFRYFTDAVGRNISVKIKFNF